MTITRRELLTRASGLIVVAAGLALPNVTKAEGLCPYGCGEPFGPLHDHLWAVGPDPRWQHDIITRESSWNPYAKNPYSTASGLAQFLDSTWEWGSELFGIYGSPFDGFTNISMMSAFVADGQTYHWSCSAESGCR